MARALIITLLFSTGCFVAPRETPIGGQTGGGGGSSSAGGGGVNPAGGGSGGGGGGLGGGSAGGSPDGGLVPLACVPGTWCWVSPTPQGQPLHAVLALSATEAWAVGDHGAMQRLRNGVWTAFTPVTDFSLERLWGSGPNDVWAVGRKPSGTSTSVYQLLHFDGATWAVVPHGAVPNVSELTGAGGEVWLLTYANTTTVAPVLQRWNGSAFVAAPALPAGAEPKSLCVRSATEVWVTASESQSSWPTVLYSWNGASWSVVHRVPAGSSRRFNSRVACPADGVAVAQVFEFDTGSYSTLETRNGAVTFVPLTQYSNLLRTPGGEAYSVSGRLVSKWTPTGWQLRFMLADDESVFSVEFDFAGDTGWLARGNPTLSAWNGSGFVPAQSSLGTLQAFAAPVGVNPQDPTAVFGDGTWGRRSGNAWTFAATPALSTGSPLHVSRAFSLPSGDAWLAGNALAKYDSVAQTVTVAVTPASGFFDAIDGSDATTLWAVGDDSKVLRFDGQQWVAPSVPLPTVVDGLTLTDVTFTAVDVASANDVVLLGNDPAGGRFVSIFYRWNGSAWSTTMSSGTTLSLFARDTLGDFYVVDGDTVKRRAPGATTWTTLGPVSGSVSRMTVFGPNEVELVVRTSTGLSVWEWDSDQQRFTLNERELSFAGAMDIVRGALKNGRPTYWGAGGFGAVLRYEPAN